MEKENKDNKDKLRYCSHRWGNMKIKAVLGMTNQYVDFYYQRCGKCGLIRIIKNYK
jgi:hypothetical protein